MIVMSRQRSRTAICLSKRCEAGAGCRFAIDTAADAPGQLDWLDSGCRRAEAAGITAGRVINTRSASEMTAGTGR